MNKCTVLAWDWKDQVDLAKLNQAISKVFDGRTCPEILEVDTGSDMAAIVVSSGPLGTKQAQGVFGRWLKESDISEIKVFTV